MKFTSPYNVMLAEAGHVVTFAKGETKFVPPALRQLALAKGLEPEEGAGIVKDVAPDDSARKEAVMAAMRKIAERNDSGDFTAGGSPKVHAIQALTGGAKPADANELLELWAAVGREAAE